MYTNATTPTIRKSTHSVLQKIILDESYLLNEFFLNAFKNSQITYFEHSRIFKNGLSFMCTNNHDFLQHFFQNHYSRPSPQIYTQSGMHLWMTIAGLKDFDNLLCDMKTIFDIDHGISFVEVHADYVDIYDFAGTQDNISILNYYLQYQEKLRAFFLAYKNKFDRFLNVLDRNAIQLPLRPKSYHPDLRSHTLWQSLTLQERRCVELLSEGKTAKASAKILTLSPRTVEQHLRNAKLKFDVKWNIELLAKIKRS